MSKNIELKLKALGIYQLVGGVISFVLTIWVIAKTGQLTGILLLIFLAVFALNSYSVFCGYLLLKNKKSGLTYSLINQFLQLINFLILGWGFKYMSGVFLSAGINLTDSFNFKFDAGISDWAVNINSDNKTVAFNFNFVALFLIIFIDKLKTNLNKQQLNTKESTTLEDLPAED